MKIALIYPPTADPTSPYISVPALTAYLREHGVEVVPIDANLEAYEYLLQPDTLCGFARLLQKRCKRLARRSSLNHPEQMAYVRMINGLRFARSAPQTIDDALDVLRDRTKKRFFDPIQYTHAVDAVEAALELIGAAFTPLELDFVRYRRPFSLLNLEQLKADASADQNPFYDYFHRKLAERLAGEGVDIVGISVVYTSQIQQAYTLGWILREKLPGRHLVAGGPALTQLFARLHPSRREKLLGPFHSAVLSEGEKPLLKLIHDLKNGHAGKPMYVGNEPLDLKELPAPDFEGLPLARYLSPEPILPYDATRGCYWGKCAFCHYGLAEKGTAPYRERPLRKMVSHLRELSERYGCRIFYLSQDTMAPPTAKRLAEGIRRAGGSFRWATDLRAETQFSAKAARELAEGGLLAVSLGLESGSPRMLNLMKKGIKKADAEKVVTHMAAAGIAVEVMVFTDFPTETYGEALATLRWLEALQGDIALFMCGRFELSAGATVAEQPEDFGIREIWTVAGDDLRSALYYRESVCSKTVRERQRIENYLTELSQHWRLSHYPWAGSLSTAHTLLWYERFGPRVFKDPARGKTRKSVRISDPRSLPIPPRFACLAEDAVQRENEIWERLVYRERVVSPERYRELAEALPAFPIGKTSGEVRCRRSPRQFRSGQRQESRTC